MARATRRFGRRRSVGELGRQPVAHHGTVGVPRGEDAAHVDRHSRCEIIEQIVDETDIVDVELGRSAADSAEIVAERGVPRLPDKGNARPAFRVSHHETVAVGDL